MTRLGAELLAIRSEPMSWSRADGITAEGCVLDGREPRQDGPSARAKLGKWSCRQQGTRTWGLGSVNEPIGRTSSPRAGGLFVGGLDFPYRSRHFGSGAWRNDFSGGCSDLSDIRRWMGRGFVFHAIAVSFDNQCLPVMHQPVDQGRGQGIVHIEQGAPFPEGSIRGQHDRSGFVTGSNYLEQQVGPTTCRWADSPAHRGEEVEDGRNFSGLWRGGR